MLIHHQPIRLSKTKQSVIVAHNKIKQIQVKLLIRLSGTSPLILHLTQEILQIQLIRIKVRKYLKNKQCRLIAVLKIIHSRQIILRIKRMRIPLK